MKKNLLNGKKFIIKMIEKDYNLSMKKLTLL